ncbi:LGFP repeat-containing protein, partial [Actinopolyspora mzabensis]
ATPGNTGQYNHFENNGSIYWSEQTGAHTIQGAIRDKWASMGWERGPLGYPTTDEQSAADGKGRYNEFAGSDGGAIYSASEGAWIEEFGATHAVYGAIYDKWVASGGVNGPLGYPITDELVGYEELGYSGRYNAFSGQDGMFALIAWSQETGAHSVQGKIAYKYASSKYGGPGGVLGYPTTDQRTTPDGQGSYNHFNGAGGSSIYSSKAVGRAHAVFGGIRDRWQQRGWERSYLGYPTSGQYQVDGVYRVDFQGGQITYYPETGEIVDRPW